MPARVSSPTLPTKSLPDFRQLPLPEQVAQLIVVRASGQLFDRQIRYPQWEPPAAILRHWLSDLNVGGVILLGGSATEVACRTQQLQSWARLPLAIAADIEEGVGQRFPGATWFPPPMAIAAIARRDLPHACALCEQMGATTAREALALGIHWILGPVADVNNNPDNPVINVRAFGEAAATVTSLVAAFIRGAQQYPVLTCAKHFPGHGDTAVDSHLTLPTVTAGPERLAQVELPPFQSAIAAGVDSIMSAHLLVPAWDAECPATVSPAVLTEQLRRQLGFTGLAVTDALIMGAIADIAPPEELPVLALEAGADILLMPADPVAAIAAVCRAVESGRIARDRLYCSLERLWHAKQRILTGASLEPATDLTAELARPEAVAAARAIDAAAMQFGGSLPASLPPGTRNLVIVDDLLNSPFLDRHVPAIAFPEQLGCNLHLLPRHQLADCRDRLCDGTPTFLQLFARGNPFRGAAGLDRTTRTILQTLIASGTLQAIAVYGSPYLLDWLHPHLPPELPWTFTYGQTPDAQEIAIARLCPSAGEKMSGSPDTTTAVFL
ncbi:glycoside hydrolase family 3 N-terminal domain-containing protein [Rubidibacter lacunae]|uniref:glycoside hydrolase family 3 N-terminal domain-containing protein n=1 Tax=Rubidibacter lacunae TaxID=582514 RepID=UPI000A06C603